MRSLRPVVSLNAGFEAQLRSLEAAHGDVFAAHQLMLKQRIESLAQQREDGQLEAAVALIKRRHAAKSQATPTIPATPTTPRAKRGFADDDDHDGDDNVPRDRGADPKPSRPFCDERGTLHGRVPSGFLLSLPVTASSSSDARSKHGVGVSHFLPTLRSMGTMVGCRACNENLFCTSSVIAHDHSHRSSNHDGKASFNGTDGASSDGDKKAKRPLLAKLRLRPHSSASGSERRENPSSPPRTGVIKPPKRDAADKARDTSSASTATSPAHASSESVARDHKHHIVEHSSFWSSLRALKASKRSTKESAGDRDDEKHKTKVQSPKAIDLASTDSISREELSHQPFLRENVTQWEHKVRVLERCCAKPNASACSTAISVLVSQEAQRMETLECDDWFVEPLHWFLGDLVDLPSGVILCPNASCGATLGRWSWSGLACSAGGTDNVAMKPSFALSRQSLRLLGTLTTPPIHQLAGSDSADFDSCVGQVLSSPRAKSLQQRK
ncbi:hypothetical protein PINS_up000580 [Pythium insidiosum]|nr:hypothetical protein PINS_up000580 [Pythium insidiosum]